MKNIKKRIEELRDKQTSRTMNQRAKYDKTAKSKDIIILKHFSSALSFLLMKFCWILQSYSRWMDIRTHKYKLCMK